MNCLARCISLLCAAWFLFYICWGSTSNGKSWFLESVAGNSNNNKAAAVPVLTLSLPILVAGSACAALLLLLSSSSSSSSGNNSSNSSMSTLPHQLPSWIHQSWHFVSSLRQKGGRHFLLFKIQPRVGDVQMGVIAVLFLVMPLVIYTACTIHRHLSSSQDENKMSLDDQVMEVGNAFGMAATVAMALVLIPVSRHSPLLQLMSWSPAHAIYLHHVAGRLVVFGGLLHGCLHSYRWTVIQGHEFLEMIIPPRTCWTINTGSNADTNDEEEEEDNDDFCYRKFRNLTGILAGVALVVLAVTTTFSFIRRSFYTVFWTCHVVAAPSVFVFVILHYEKAILYVAGGVLYYLATTVPVWLETKKAASAPTISSLSSTFALCCNSSNQKQVGVPIVAVQRIPTDSVVDADSTTGCIMSVTIQVDHVALERFRAGQYVRLVAPGISMLAHPFTINFCPLSLRQQRQQQQHGGQDNTTSTHDDSAVGNVDCMQITFRATGPFTKQLAQRLLFVVNTNTATLLERPLLPVLRLDGFYGPSNRLRTAQEHDVILIVAGGIGITPYLSLLQQLHQNLVASFRQAKDKQQQQSLILQGPTAAGGGDSRHYPFRTKKLVLHWMCRDAALIDYIKREYLAPLLDSSNSTDSDDDNDFGIQLVIHQTGTSTRRRWTSSSSTTATLFSNRDDTHNPQDDDNEQNRTREQAQAQQERVVILERLVGVPFRPSKFAAGTKTSYLANAPLFLSFCLIGWIGLILIWYCFTNFDSKHQVMPRSYSLVCVLILSLVMASILNSLFTPAWEDEREDACYAAISNETSADYNDEEDTTANTVGDLSLQVELATRNGPPTALHQTEQEGVKDHFTCSSGLLRGALDDASFGVGRGSALVTLQERCGRPIVSEFLHVFDSNRANYPAVYACGPNDLTRSLRLAVNERQCRMCYCKIALYQERFEL